MSMEAEGTNPQASCTATSRVGGDDVYMLYSPCQLLREAVKAILKCLGYDDEGNTSSTPKPSGQDQSHSTPADPPSDPAPKTLRGRTPPRPPVGGGRGPQTNSSPAA